MALPSHAVDVDPGSGRAVYQAHDLPLPDYLNFVNAVTGGAPVPGRVSFRVEWAPAHDKHHYRNAAHRWEGTFVQNSATCTWSGHTAAADFSTDTNNPTIFAEVGHQHSGVFFTGHDD